MNVLVTGARGFIGKNLIATLQNIKTGKDKSHDLAFEIGEIYAYDVDCSEKELAEFAAKCDFVFHLAGINRPLDTTEFMSGNFGFTTLLLNALIAGDNSSPILMSSSIQADMDNDYGKSKKAGENYLMQYGRDNNLATYIYRLPNVFGKWCRPNYNSAVATFCNNIACGLPIQVNNREILLTLVYIDDVVNSFIKAMKGDVNVKNGYCAVTVQHEATLGHIVDTLHSFKDIKFTNILPRISEGSLEKKLYSTYLSYLPKGEFGYDLKMNVDVRGSFTEFIKTADYGQISVNISKPHIVKGNHWHDTKNEKFLVVSGSGVIRFRKVGETEIIEYHVCGEKLRVIDIPCGYTHNIENIGETDMVTIMWANELLNSKKPDTYYLEV